MKYVIENDDSGHFYVIPREQLVSWNSWIHSEAWKNGEVPSYAVPVGRYDRITFDSYEVE